MSSLSSKENSKWLQAYIHSPEKQNQLFKRTLWVVVLSQIFGGAGLAAGITVGALIAQDMLGTDSFSGVPTALFTLGSAGAALLVGRFSQRHGRRFGLGAGFLVGGIGAIGVIFASLFHHIFLLFASLLVYGAGSATNLQARYAGTDLANAKQRATAISIALVSTTLGAVAGPNLVKTMGKVAEMIGVPPLTGPFILAAAAYFIAGSILLLFLNPDPFLVAKALAVVKEDEKLAQEDTNSLLENKRKIIAGASVMVLSQMVMVAIMTMTPVHMRHHGHDLSAVGMIIGLHVGAMYLPSLITGVLVDKIGRTSMAIASGITLLSSGIVAAIAPAESMILLSTALILLGLGWNFGLISGTALIVDATTPFNRAKIQGSVDVLIALSGVTGGVLSGLVVASSSYAVLSLAGGVIALLLIPFVIWSNSHAVTEKERNRNFHA